MKSYFVSFIVKNLETNRKFIFNVDVEAANKVRAKNKACAKAVIEFPFDFEISSWVIKEKQVV